MRRLILLTFVCCLLVLTSAVYAQGASPWEVVLYTEIVAAGRSGELTVVTPNGISARYVLPASLYSAYPDASVDVIISPDRHYAAVAFYPGTEAGAPPIAVVDLTTGACCTYVTSPLQPTDNYSLGAFSPDSTQFSYVYIGFTDRETFTTDAALVTVDAASGLQTGLLSLSRIPNLPDFTAFAHMGAWDEHGVHFLPSCYACDGVFEGAWYVWDPKTINVTQSTDEFFSIFGSTLDETGEMLYMYQNAAFPSGLEEGMFPPANVVEYYDNGVPLTLEQRNAGTAAPVVYHNAGDLNLSQAHWIMDGNAFFLPGHDSYPNGTIVYRDGTSQQFPFPADYTFLAGTPDGFLAQDAANTVIFYRVTGVNAEVEQIPMEQFPAAARVIDSPALGASVNRAFTTIAAPPSVPAQAAGQCPGFGVSRLVVGGQGRVTLGGAPNRLRQEPNTSATILTQIQPGGVFSVISGPQCDPSGIAWWQVNVNGTIGWTAEGQGDTYYLEPV